jgi:hypothetical protein
MRDPGVEKSESEHPGSATLVESLLSCPLTFYIQFWSSYIDIRIHIQIVGYSMPHTIPTYEVLTVWYRDCLSAHDNAPPPPHGEEGVEALKDYLSPP